MMYESGLSEISDTVGSWSDVDGLPEHLMMEDMVVVLGSELKGEVPPLDSITPQSQNEHLGKGFRQEMTGLYIWTWHRDIPIIVAKDIDTISTTVCMIECTYSMGKYVMTHEELSLKSTVLVDTE